MNVTGVVESVWKKDDGDVKVTKITLEDGREVPGYDLPQLPEVGKPLPDGWEVATAKSGKLYIKVPKRGGGGFGGGTPAFRNTKEGQAFEQQQMNRRTALMQTVALFEPGTLLPNWLGLANDMYDWLQSSPASGHTEPRAEVGGAAMGAASPSPGTSPSRGVVDTTPPGSAGEVTPAPLDTSSGGEVPYGEGGTSPSDCIHPTRVTTPSGKIRCTVCREIVVAA